MRHPHDENGFELVGLLTLWMIPVLFCVVIVLCMILGVFSAAPADPTGSTIGFVAAGEEAE